MDSNQIERIIWSYKEGRKYFKGCFPCDKIPQCSQYPVAYIINEDDSNKGGSHWVAIFIKDFETVYFFDSYATLYSNMYILNFLKNFKTVIINPYPFQSILSNVCAQYCIFFVISMIRGMLFSMFLRILYNQLDPDYYVKVFVNNFVNNTS